MEKLRRDIVREGLIRLEEAARSESDFTEVIEMWDRFDSNRERRERYHERTIHDKMFDWNIFNSGNCPADNILDLIYLNVDEMHNIASDPDISRLIKNATDKQKAVFFPRIFVGCSTSKIACCHCMTDRNVRKLIDTMLNNIRNELFVILKKRSELTLQQRRFLNTYKPKKKRGGNIC